jgi:serine/threonine protein kinase
MAFPNEREEALFEAAAGLPPQQRAAYLEKACGSDAQLLQRLFARLVAHVGAGVTAHAPPLISSGVSAPLTEGPGTVIGRYKLLEQLGEGGFGVVYVAEQREPVKRRVALKVIKLGMDTKQVIARFEAERQALALMDHPNIAKVLDAGATDTGRPYFVMELVRGIRITDYCDQNNLSIRQRLDLFMRVCQAIQHAHQKGIIHRDIKPSNILVTLHDPDSSGVPKVIDFGIAKATQGELTDKTVYTRLQEFIGTPAYMSPEQAEMSGLDIDTRADIYSLGVLLYELLTGKTPFDGKELLAAGVEQMRRIIRLNDPLRPSTCLRSLDGAQQTKISQRRRAEPSKLIHQVRGDLDWIVMKALDKDRTRRYGAASDLAADIERHLQNQTVLARPPTWIYRLQRLLERHKLGFAAAGSVTVALLIGAGLFVKAQSELRQRQRAEQAAKLDAGRTQYAEQLFREALRNLRELRDDDPVKQSAVFALILHHVSDLLLHNGHALEEARVLSEQATAMYRHHEDWPLSEQQHALEVQARVLKELGDLAALRVLYPDVLAASRRVVSEQDLEAVRTLQRLARIFFDAGMPAEARALYKQVVECYGKPVEARDPKALNGLAWLLATCGDAAMRDGARAVGLSERAVEMTRRKDANFLDTLAAAYAEAGQFSAAVKAQKEAMDLLTDQVSKDGFAIRLGLYESRRAFHE